MPISDKVIELETKKTGRNVLFIVLIALLAAVSVVFAVLWVVKAPAVDPPSIEEITISQSDMYRLPNDENSAIPKFALSPRCEYTVTFDMALKANTEEDEVNYILDVRTEPAGMIDITEGHVNEATKQYVLTFTVKANAQKNFQIIAESVYAQKADRSVMAAFQVTLSDTAYVASFDVSANANGVKTLRDSGNISDVTELVPQTDKNTANELHYKLKNPLPYFGEASAVFYSLPFEQIGKRGTDDKNGAYEKVPSYEINGRHFDEVQVFAANGKDLPTANYKEIDFGGGEGVLRQIRYPGVAGRDYFRNGLRFCADEKGMNAGTGTSTLKIVANAFNGAPEQYTIYVEITFVTKDLLGKITEIRFVDPFTQTSEVNKNNCYEMDWYIDDNNKTICLDDCIQAVRGKEDGKDKIESGAALHWGEGDLTAFVSDKDGNRREGDPLIQMAQGKCSVSFRSNPMNTAGTAYVTVSDTDRDGFKAKCVIELHIRVSVRAVTGDNGLNATPGKPAIADVSGVYAGNTVTKDIVFETATYRPKDDDKDALVNSVNTFCKAEYLTPEIGGNEQKQYQKPTFNAKGELSNADDTIYLAGLGRDYSVTPSVKRKGDTWSFASTLSFAVGKNVATGEYRIALTLTPQSLVLPTPENKLTHCTPAESIRVEFVIHVVRLAQKICVQKTAVDNADKHTLWEIGADSATLWIAAGTGTSDGAHKYTSFSLYDILTFADEKGVIQTDEETRQDNYGQLHVDCGAAEMTDVFYSENVTQKIGELYRNARFRVPSDADTADDATVALTFENDKGEETNRYALRVRYYWAVEKVECNSVEHTLSYDWESINGKDEKQRMLNNIHADNVTAYSRVDDSTSAIASANKLKDADDLQLDIVVLRGGAAKNDAAKLPKREFEIGGEKYVYFFRSIADEEETSDPANAYFRAQKSYDSNSLWHGWNIAVLRDVFSISVGLDWDCHSLRLCYSYGKNLVTTENGVIQIAEGKENLVAISNYQLVRRFDELRFYEKSVEEGEYAAGETTDNVLLSSSADGSTGEIVASSGASFHVYPVGVVRLENGKEYWITDNRSPYKSSEIELGFSDSGRFDSQKIDGFNYVTITCATEAKGMLKFHEVGTEKLIYLSVSVNNQATPIESIALYWDEACSQAIGENDSRQLFTNRRPDTLAVYYEVTYKKFNGTEKGLEKFELTAGKGVSVTNKSDLPNFTTFEITAGTQYVYTGKVELTATENAAETNFAVQSNPARLTASLALQVSTVIQDAAVTFIDRYGATINIADSASKDAAFKYDVAGNRENSRDFTFVFAPKSFDSANLSYRAVWNVTSGNASDIRGVFYDGNAAEYADANTKGKNIAGYRVYFGNTPIAATLTIYVDEQIAEDVVSHAFTVEIDVDSTVARMQATYDGQAFANNGKLVMVVGQPSIPTLDVTLYAYASGTETVEKDISFAVGSPRVLSVVKNGNTFSFMPTAAGDCEVSLSADGKTFVFTVQVIEPALKLTFTSGNERNVYTNDNIVLPLSCAFDPVLPTGVTGNAFAFTIDGAAIDTLSWLTFTRTALGQYTLTVHKSELTAALLGEHTLGVASSVSGVPVTQEAKFTLEFSGYEPQLLLTRTDGAPTNGAVDKAALRKYSFALANPLGGYGENNVSISFASDALELSQAGTVASVIDLKAGFAGLSGQTTVTVAVLGRSYAQTLTFTLCDTNSIRGALYYYAGEANLNNLLKDDGSIRTDVLSSIPADIGYTDADAAYRMILVVDYSGLPQAATMTIDDLIVNRYGTANLTVGEPVLLHMQDAPYYYYAIQYRIDTTGDVTLDVRTVKLSGSEYAVGSLTATFEAVIPAFSWKSGDSDIAQVTLDPDGTAQVTIAPNTFKGGFDFTYAWASPDADNNNMTSDRILRVGKDGNVLTFTAATGLGGCNTSLTVTVTVTSGAFAGQTYTLSLPVTVTRYATPAATSGTVWLAGVGDRTEDIRKSVTVRPDPNDTNFAYTVTNLTVENAATGSMQGVQFVASGSGVAKIGYTVSVTAGYYMGYTFTVSFEDGITVVTAPQTTFNVSTNSVTAGQTVTLYPSAGDATIESLRYTLSNDAAGTIAGNVFTANKNFAGSVTITAYFDTLSYQGSKGAGKTATVDITVTAIPAPEIKVDVNGLKYTVSANVNVTAEHVVLSGSENLIAVERGADGKTFTVTKQASKTGGTAVFTIAVTVNDSRYTGTPYACTTTYTYTVAVEPISAPVITIDTQIDTNGLGVYAIQSNVVITSEYTVLAGNDLITVTKNEHAYTVTAKDKALGGKAVVEISYTVTDSRYEGTVYATTTKQTYTITVPTLVAPDISVTEPSGNGGLGDYTVVNNGTQVSITTSVLAGDELVTVSKSGNVVTVAAKDKALGGKAVVKITVQVTDDRYAGTVYATTTDYVYTVTVPDLSKPVIKVQAPLAASGLGDYTVVNNGTQVNITTSVLSGDELVSVSKSGNTVTVAAKPNTLGGKAVVKITVQVTDERYAGTVYATTTDYVYTVTTTAAAKPTSSSISVSAANNADKTGGNVTVTTSATGYTVKSVAYTCDGSYLSFTGNAYTFLKKNTAQKTVTVTAVVVLTGSPYGEVTVSKPFDVIVPPIGAKPVMDASKITYDLTKAGNGNSEYTGHFIVSDDIGDFEVLAYVPQSAGIVMGNSGSFAYTAGAGNVNVTVLYRITAGDYAGETATIAVTVHILALPTLSATVANGIVTVTGGAATLGAYDAALVTVTKQSENRFAYTFKKGVGTQDIQLTFTSTVASGDYAGYTISCTVTLQANETVPTARFDADNMLVIAENIPANASVTYASNIEDVTVDDSGKVGFTDTASGEYEVVFTVTVTVNGGEYAGCEYALTVPATLTAPEKTPEVDPSPEVTPDLPETEQTENA